METSIIAKLAGITNELTLAAAKLNFDFTLIKVEAPKEYSGVNDSLSEARRENAENGALHRTARKLGALFDGIPPSAGHLLAAYGKRVSEICQKAKISPQDRERHGIFARYCGTDSGGLWAAATSGTNAIAVHLLACMMAEAFKAPESVSLWCELIERRKAEIGNTLDQAGSVDMATLLACKQEFSRSELAAWDNSARSWIQTANNKTRDQRNTVLHYTDKTGLAVNRDFEPYQSVTLAWKDAMSSMDSLIMGVPQKVRNGAILLAMRSWHLYPDLCILDHGPDVISQKDGLFPTSGIITIDLEHTDDTAGSISWSLPLSYLRYYGDPVIVNQTLGVASDRISMDQFRFVLLGCVICTWSKFTKSVDEALDLLMTLVKALRWPERSTPDPSNLQRMQKITSKTSWLGQILTAAEDLSSGGEIERATARKLMGYGRRYDFCIGDSEVAEIVSIGPMTRIGTDPDPRRAQLGHGSRDIGRYFSADILKEVLGMYHFDYVKLTDWFATHMRALHPVFLRSLRGCASAVEMYGRLPDATVDPEIISKISLSDASWISSREEQHSSPLRLTLTRPEAFACITMFECGRLLDVGHFQEVFAITSNDAIFVATPLLADPYEAPIDTEIKRVSGNIGKPGVSLLVPPPEPRIREANTGEWNLLNHNSFSGEAEDNFPKTSMHLSLTQYQQGLLDRTTNQHYIDNNTVLHEALVQVFDSSKWVGDLNLLSTLSSSLISRVECHCREDASADEQSFDSSLAALQKSFSMIIVDNWEELLIPPLDPAISVVRAADNWIGRLAAAGISIRLKAEEEDLGKLVLIL
ncbi:uncharacterized protein T069G_11403 [Trichoderma breve]|uniref:Uncharacterized protein n=1 Tax=Trichoderma breve TaxID=2034170 RepID=A0A9W9B4X4_9HYPO|nr:uncharacterized protein T069G_11403 [Trichoderma breve]KAJ4854424.1 hypothetical protein T069G_11403 [Trichoderma breve]